MTSRETRERTRGQKRFKRTLGSSKFAWAAAMAILQAMPSSVLCQAQEAADVSRNHTVVDALPEGYFQESYVHNAMGTYFEIILYGERGKDSSSQFARATDEAFATIDRLENRVSNWIPSSQTSRANREAADHPVRVAPDIFGMLEEAQTFYRETGGAFDVTVGPLVELWRACKKEKRLPAVEEVAAARALVGFDKVTLDPAEHTVSFARPGMRLDFGGIGKGMALDEAAGVLKDYGVKLAILHGGTSSIVAMGAPPGKPGWTIRVRDPYREDEDIATFVLRDESFSTSGHLVDMVEIDGKKYGHIFNPITGTPIQGMLMSMAIALTGTQTDALSTAFFVMGREGTERYCKEHPGIRAVLVPDSGNENPAPVRFGFDH